MRISFSVARSWAANLWRARVRHDAFLRPLGVTWHATNACNLRCGYCDDGRGNMYPELRGKVMTTGEAKQVLSLARGAVDMLYVTGGEPLVRSDIGEIIRWAKEKARFNYIGLATNGVLLYRHESLLEHVDELEISLDSLDDRRYDALLGAAEGTSKKIREAVIRSHRLASELRYQLVVTCVAIPGRIGDARAVIQFCFDRGIACELLPQSKGPYPHPDLKDDPDYALLMEEVCAAKRRGAAVYGTFHYYDHIKAFKAFRCYPTLVPRILPNGDLCYPCAPLGTIAGNLVGARSFLEVLAAGREAHGPVPSCDARCFASCYIETSNCISAPAATVWEHVETAFWPPRFIGSRASRTAPTRPPISPA